MMLVVLIEIGLCEKRSWDRRRFPPVALCDKHHNLFRQQNRRLGAMHDRKSAKKKQAPKLVNCCNR